MDQTQTPAVLSPAGATVEFAYATPSTKVARLLGTIEVADEGREADDAERGARTELRNRAAEMGASLVTVDTTMGERVLFHDMVKVTVVGRAYRSLD